MAKLVYNKITSMYQYIVSKSTTDTGTDVTIVNTIAERDALEDKSGIIWVKNATADEDNEIPSGGALYLFESSSNQWILLSRIVDPAQQGVILLEAGDNIEITDNPITGAKIITSRALTSTDIPWTVNNQVADETGNFSITPALVGAAEAVHEHVMSDIAGLADEFAAKAPAAHSHQLVSGISVDGVEQAPSTSTAVIKGSSHLRVSSAGSTISLEALPYEVIMAESIQNAALTTENVKMFVGTTAEWTDFTKDTETTYIVALID